MMALTYYRTYAQAIAKVQETADVTRAVAQSINGNQGVIVVRDLTAQDLGTQVVEIPAGNFTVTIASGVVPSGKAYGIYGFELTSPFVKVANGNLVGLTLDVYVGGSRVKRVYLDVVNDDADTGLTYYIADKSIVMKQQIQYSFVLSGVNLTGSTVTLMVNVLGFVGEPNGVTIIEQQ
jgi:hypothetical protein